MGSAAPSTQWTSIMAKGLLNLSATTLAMSCDGVTGVNISQLQLEISIDDYVHGDFVVGPLRVFSWRTCITLLSQCGAGSPA